MAWRRKLPLWAEIPLLVVIALVLTVLIKSFLIQTFRIPSRSMEDTLLIGDRVIVNELAYTRKGPEPGDIVVFEPPWSTAAASTSLGGVVEQHLLEALGIQSPEDENLIKRVVAVGGQTIGIHDNRVWVDGVPVDESYLYPGTSMPPLGPVEVPEGYIFVMGDHRDDSTDSRVFGPIPADSIVGKAFLRYWPFNRFGGFVGGS